MKTESILEKIRITYEFFFSNIGVELVPVVCSK